jgi:protein required for attachment to host cells
MQVPHRGFVVVADGKKMLFFRNEGDSVYPKLEVERKREQANPADRDQKTDLAGQAPSGSGGAGYSSYGETDFHQLEEDRFAAETAELLRKRALNNDFESLIKRDLPRLNCCAGLQPRKSDVWPSRIRRAGWMGGPRERETYEDRYSWHGAYRRDAGKEAQRCRA